MNILTWSSHSNNGAFQKPIDTRIFSDMLTVKPTFSFAYTDLQYIEQNNTYTINGMLMTDAQKIEVLAYIDSVVPPLEWYKAVKSQEISAAHQSAIEALDPVYTPVEEMITWRKQEEQARAWNVDNTTVTPMLDGLLIGRNIVGETKQDLVNVIIYKADAYESAYAPILGNYQAKIKAVSSATTAAEVDSITW